VLAGTAAESVLDGAAVVAAGSTEDVAAAEATVVEAGGTSVEDAPAVDVSTS